MNIKCFDCMHRQLTGIGNPFSKDFKSLITCIKTGKQFYSNERIAFNGCKYFESWRKESKHA